MEFTIEYLESLEKEELVEIALKLQQQLKVSDSWWKYHAEREIALFEKLHCIELPKD